MPFSTLPLSASISAKLVCSNVIYDHWYANLLSSVVINTIVGLSFININALLVFIVFEPIIILGHLWYYGTKSDSKKKIFSNTYFDNRNLKIISSVEFSFHFITI